MSFPPILLAILAATLVAAEILVVAFFLHRVAVKSDAQREFEEQVSTLTESELESDTDKGVSLNPKSWTGFWYKLVINTGRKPDKPEQPSQLVAIMMLIAFGIGFLVWPRSILAGLLFAIGAAFIFLFILRFEAKRRIHTLEAQLSLLVDSLMASISADQTPQVALMNAADEIPSPLGDELKQLKNEIATNVPMSRALRSLSERVPSREIKFLVSAIEIAIESGTNLQPQLEIIRDTINKRATLQQKLASAVASAQPALWISGIVIPAGMVFSLFSNTGNRSYWMSLVGLVTIAVVGVLYVVGLFVTKKLVDGVEKV